jgi:hypothetical protein
LVALERRLLTMAGMTLRDVFLRDGDPFDGLPTLPPDEPEEEEGHDCPEDDECPICQHLEEIEGCGKAGRRGACGHCEDCADYGDAKYHESVDRMIERESEEHFFGRKEKP